jgi:hypothetical protein
MSVHATLTPEEYATKERCEKFRLFLLQYTTEHGGQTPTVDLMIREMQAPEGCIRFMLRKLERLGLIMVISRNPLRLIVKTPGYDPLAGSDNKTRRPDAVERFLGAEGTRHRIGRYIGEIESKTGRGPTIRQMMSYLQYDNAGWVHRACSILADRGLITFGTGLPTKLTKLGREFYGVSEKPMQKTEDKPQAQQPQSQHRQVAVVPKTRSNIVKFRRQMVEKVGQYLATHYRRNNKGRYIAESIGHSRNAVYGAIHTMTEKGWVHPEKPFSKKG